MFIADDYVLKERSDLSDKICKGRSVLTDKDRGRCRAHRVTSFGRTLRIRLVFSSIL